MTKRFNDALMIQQGACNPSGIARTLVAACKECLDENGDQRNDPAIRLIVHQLAYLCNVAEFDSSLTAYGKATEACESR